MSTLRGRPPRGFCLAGGISGSTIAHCSSVRSEGYFFRDWSPCTMCAHSSADEICANYRTNLLFCQAIFPDSLLVCDNLNTHTKGAFYEAFAPERARVLVRRLEFCYTPKHGSWLNIAENELSSLTRQCVADRRFGDVASLREETQAWSNDVNATQRGVDWQMKIDDARTKLKSVYPTIKL